MIPQWNNAAVLPPIRPGQPGHSPDRSPYRVSLTAVIERLATSPERIKILRGLIAYRTAFMQTVTSDGFQWLDGSFMENKEILAGESPRDVDVVTFYRLPSDRNQSDLASSSPLLFDHDHVKKTWLVDAYTCQTGLSLERYDVRRISYWHSMWSHRRNGIWKGFVQVELSLAEDQTALNLLDQIEKEGASQ
ncbi:MAG: hypothetical protein LBK99_03185 [Opitutaceae bacterium]|jgi:hypothetical protein|nr:hypothetical protein [Opitutaceae bacterium]